MVQTPSQMLSEFKRVSALLRRPRIRAELAPERQALCSHMAAQLRDLKDLFQVWPRFACHLAACLCGVQACCVLYCSCIPTPS